jgi:diaminohydroxyphosphoribosylaminopyrimidine deaminase/5-amino-6-(5-phosphoribosylamino)uracil reductase
MGMTATFTNQGVSPKHIADAFARALSLARAHEGATAPNPPVGCVLLDAAGQTLAEGAHQRAGMPHAEAQAIAGASAAGVAGAIDTVVVTLEPCNHHGRTPPCAKAILATGARQVWIARRDPNPQVAGGGAERLQAAGLRVRFLADLDHPAATALHADAERLLAPFAKRSRTRLPFITIKQAVSPAGSMIPAAGRKTFTSAVSLDLAHRLRRQSDAILTGSGTVLADGPLFTVRRVPDHPGKQRMLVILDRRGRVADDYILATRQRGFAVCLAGDVHEALAMIGAAGGLAVLVEAGPALTGSLLDAGLWDEHVLIEQAANPDGTDRVTILRNTSREFLPNQEDANVFRHH